VAGRTLSRPHRATATASAVSASDPSSSGAAFAATNTLGPTGTSNRSTSAAPSGPAIRRHGRPRSQVRGQWLVLAAALTVLAGLLVAWSLDRAADRVEVVSVARHVPAGTVIEPGDLTTTAIAFDTPVAGLAPAASLDALVGRVATVDLDPGVLLSTAMWADGSELGAGERTVGALLDAGTYPGGISPGTSALAVSVHGGEGGEVGDAARDGGAADGAGSADVTVRVLDADVDARGALRVTLAVPAADAPRIARLAATDGLVLVGVPAAGVPTAGVAGPAGPAADGRAVPGNGMP